MNRPAESVVHGSQAPANEATASAAALQNLPSTDRLLRHPTGVELVAAHGHTLVANQARALLDDTRAQLLADADPGAAITPDALAHRLVERVAARLAPRMQPVLNLTGTVIHTNLGRALLADAALAHVQAAMAGPNNLEFDLASGSRGDRDSIVEGLLCELTGA